MAHTKYQTGLSEIGGEPIVQGGDSESVSAVSADASDSHNEYAINQEQGTEQTAPKSGDGPREH